MADDTLGALRDTIDAIDDELLVLLARRARIAVEVARAKEALGRPLDYDPGRERDILARREQTAGHPLGPAGLRAIFREVISACRAVQRPLSIAYLGPEGTYSHVAVGLAFGDSSRARPYPTIDAVLDAVAAGEVARGVVPIENSTEGSVGPTLRGLVRHALHIERELTVPIEHCLAATSPRMADITTVTSHSQGLAQCAGWIQRNLGHVTQVPAASTAAAAESCVGVAGRAAIASEAAAAVFGLHVLARGIQDKSDNATRFVVVGPERSSPSGRDRTTLVFGLADGAGVLRRALSVFEGHGISLSRIESMPDRERAWNHLFVVEFDGHSADPPVRAALQELEGVTTDLRLLGSYSRG